METEIICVLRKYHVKFAGGATIVIESEKELSEEDTRVLLEQDPEIGEFVKHCRITGVLHPMSHKKLDPVKKVESVSKKIEPEVKPKLEPVKGGEQFLSIDKRIKHLLNMPGDFTSLDYIRSLEKIGCKISVTQANYAINKVMDKLETMGSDNRYTVYRVKSGEKKVDERADKGSEQKIVLGVGQEIRNPERHLSDILLEDRKNQIEAAK